MANMTLAPSIDIGGQSKVNSIPNVGTPCAVYIAASRNWDLINDLSNGTEAMRHAGRKWLRPNSAETFASYERRLYSTYLYEGLNLAIKMLLGKPFSEDAVVSDELKNGPLAQYLSNIDKCGSDITTFARKVADIGLRKGLCHILVDYNNTTGIGEITLEQKTNLNIRPYAVAIDPERVIGWRYDLNGNVPILTQLRITENYEKPLGEWGTVATRRVKVFERIIADNQPLVAWTLYEEQDQTTSVANAASSTTWKVVDSGYVTMSQIPVVTIYFGEQTGFMQARPPLMGVAWLNQEHWQSSSEQRNILNVARCPIWFFAGYEPAVDSDGRDSNKVVVAPDAMIRASDPNAKLSIVEHTGACINAGRQDLLDIEARMAHLSTELLTKKHTSSSSATEKAHDNKGEDCQLAAMIKTEEDGLSTMFALMYEYESVTPPVGKLIELNTSFGLEAQDAADLQALFQSRIAGLISQATYLAELKRRGVLAASVSVDAEMAAAQKDGPVQPPAPQGPDFSSKAGAGA